MILLQRLKLAFAGIMIFAIYPISSSEPIISPSSDIYHLSSEPDLDFTFDDIFFDEQDYDPFSNEFLDTVGNNQINKGFDPETVLIFLLHLGIIDILKEPLYLRTNELNRRSPLDQPIFEPDRPQFPGSWIVGVTPYLRKTTRSNFTKNSTNFDSYLALNQPTLLQKLENTIRQFPPEFNFDTEKILGLFENMTVEQRQLGLMLHCTKKKRKTTFRIFAPLYYLENNFFLTEKEQDAIAEVFGKATPEQEKRFRKAHFINDKIGLGDTRIEIDKRILKRPSFSLRMGGFIDLPTAWKWGEGFLGSSYPKPSTYPVLNIEPLFDAINNPTTTTENIAFEDLSELLFNAFDRIAANLIDIPLGNSRHFGFGPYIRGKTALSSMINTPLAEHITFCNRISLELFLPATEKRFYVNKINVQELNDRNFENDEQAAANLMFLEEKIIERIFLRAFDTRIWPGVIFRWLSQAEYVHKDFGFNLGTDFWLQDKAKFSSIAVTETTLKQLNRAKARQSIAYQSKIFGGLIFRHKAPQASWYFSLNGDITISNKGIGNDYGLSLNFEASF